MENGWRSKKQKETGCYKHPRKVDDMNDKQKVIIDAVTESIDCLSNDDIGVIISTCLAAVQREVIKGAIEIKDPVMKSKAIANLAKAGLVTLKVED